jgi:hypothetical protein
MFLERFSQLYDNLEAWKAQIYTPNMPIFQFSHRKSGEKTSVGKPLKQ